MYNSPPTHVGTTGGRRQCRWPETMQSTSMNTTVSSLNNNNDTLPQQQFPKKGSPIIKILSMNCHSMKGNTKNCEFRALLQQHHPHVIVGCESKIDSTFPTYSLPFSLHGSASEGPYQTRRRSGAIRGDVLAPEENDLTKDNECVWSSIQLPQSQKLYLGSFYRPPGAPLKHLQHLEESLTEMDTKCMRRHPNAKIAGDFNVGDITSKKINV